MGGAGPRDGRGGAAAAEQTTSEPTKTGKPCSSATCSQRLASKTQGTFPACRYRDRDAEQADAAAALGPVQRSRGADLAQLLAQVQPFDRAHFFRARAHLLEECGAPPEVPAGTLEGLSIDLEGLAACLDLMSKNRLLSTDAFSEDDDEDWDVEDEVPDLAEDDDEEEGSACAAQQPAPDAPSRPVLRKTELEVGAETAAAARNARPPAEAPAAEAEEAPALQRTAASRDTEDVDDLLSELLGETVPPQSLQQGQQQSSQAAPDVSGLTTAAAGRHSELQRPAAAVASERRPQQPPLAATASAGFRPLQQQQQQHQRSPEVPDKQRALEEEADDELDKLLGLAPGKLVNQGGDDPPAPESKPDAQSLEAWLDAL